MQIVLKNSKLKFLLGIFLALVVLRVSIVPIMKYSRDYAFAKNQEIFDERIRAERIYREKNR